MAPHTLSVWWVAGVQGAKPCPGHQTPSRRSDIVTEPMRDDLLPPEIITDEPPVSDEEFDAWAAQAEGEWELPPAMAEFAVAPYAFEQAEWAMAKLARYTADLATTHERAEALHEKIAAWFDRESAVLETKARYFDGVLTNMLRQVNAEDPGIKTIRLPSGTITSSGPRDPDEMFVEFDGVAGKEAFIEWAYTNNRIEMLKIEPEALISEVRENVQARPDGTVVVADPDGEVVAVPGLSARRRERTFKAKPGA